VKEMIEQTPVVWIEKRELERLRARIAELDDAIKNCSGSCHAVLAQHNGDKT